MNPFREPDRFRARCIAAALVWLVALAWAPAGASANGRDDDAARAPVDGTSQLVTGRAAATPGRALLALESFDDDDDDRIASAAVSASPTGCGRDGYLDAVAPLASAPPRARALYLTSPKTSPPVHPSR